MPNFDMGDDSAQWHGRAPLNAYVEMGRKFMRSASVWFFDAPMENSFCVISSNARIRQRPVNDGFYFYLNINISERQSDDKHVQSKTFRCPMNKDFNVLLLSDINWNIYRCSW